MAELDQNYIPYAGISGVATVLDRLRNASLPDTLDRQSIQRIGISKGIAGRTVAAIQFLGIIDESGNKTEVHDRLAKATTNDYPDVLAEALRVAYSEIFKVVDPSSATDVELHDAFRGFDPAKQRGRMVSLFIGLCQVANIREGEPTIIRHRQSSSRASAPKNGEQNKQNNHNNLQDRQLPPPPGKENPLLPLPLHERYELLAVLFKKLPSNGKWTSEHKELWLKGVEFAVDMEVDVVEED